MNDLKKSHIRRIREEFLHGSDRIRTSLNNSIHKLATDLYSKDTHFIFELIQNAEDNEYDELTPSLSFNLTKNDPTKTAGSTGALIIGNNEIGFSDENVDAICAVGETTKEKHRGYIGEKGIGFKSVFRVTTTPYIFSNGYYFRFIEEDEATGIGYIVPYWVENIPEVIKPSMTTIILPLDKSDFSYSKIEEMLRDIEPETILFLSKLKDLNIKTDTGDELSMIKDDASLPEVTIYVEGNKKGNPHSEYSEYLLYKETFDKPDVITQEKRGGINEREISIAFPQSDNMDNAGKIFAYLPVRSDTGLPFLINADFILTSSREDIKNNLSWNLWLMNCVGEIVAKSMQKLKIKERLTVELLEMITSRVTDFEPGSIYYPIAKSVKRILTEDELLPSDDGAFVSAKNAKLASAEWLRKLINGEKLREVYKTEKHLKWISGTITDRKTTVLWKYLRDVLGVEELTPDNFSRKIDTSFIENRSNTWLSAFYTRLLNQRALWQKGGNESWGDKPGPLRAKHFIRLQSGNHVKPFKSDGTPNAYLTLLTDTETSLPIVNVELSQQQDVLNFMKALGIPELDIVEEVIDKILPKYLSHEPIDAHLTDLAMIKQAFKTDSEEKKRRLVERLKETPFILAEASDNMERKYRKPTDLYFWSEELGVYFSSCNIARFVKSNYYDQSDLALFEKLGVSNEVRVICKSRIGSTDNVQLEYKRGYRQGLYGFDPDIEVDGIEEVLNSEMSNAKSAYIWNKIACPYNTCVKGKILRSSRQDFSPKASTYEIDVDTSTLGNNLLTVSWLPDLDGKYHKPSELKLDDLPESFNRNELLGDILGMKKDVVAKLAELVGISVGDIEFIKNNKDEFQKWKNARTSRTDSSFPEKTTINPENRKRKMLDRIDNAPNRNTEMRGRIVPETDDVEQNVFLRTMYTNQDGKMFCQICKREMRFKKPNKEYYFESVEMFLDFKQKLVEQHIALCPLCSAMYRVLFKRDDKAVRELKDQLLGNCNSNEFQFDLGEDKNSSIRFVDKHLFDLRVILEYERV
jgi:hypothetical protein